MTISALEHHPCGVRFLEFGVFYRVVDWFIVCSGWLSPSGSAPSLLS